VILIMDSRLGWDQTQFGRGREKGNLSLCRPSNLFPRPQLAVVVVVVVVIRPFPDVRIHIDPQPGQLDQIFFILLISFTI